MDIVPAQQHALDYLSHLECPALPGVDDFWQVWVTSDQQIPGAIPTPAKACVRFLTVTGQWCVSECRHLPCGTAAIAQQPWACLCRQHSQQEMVATSMPPSSPKLQVALMARAILTELLCSSTPALLRLRMCESLSPPPLPVVVLGAFEHA